MYKSLFCLSIILFLSCNNSKSNDEKKQVTTWSANKIKMAIRSLEEVEWAEASSKKDKSWFEQHLADDLVMTTGRTGEVTNKQQVIAEIMDPAYGIGGSDRLEDLHIIPLNNSGIATFKILTKGKDKTGPYFRIARYTEVWVHKDERWQLVASHSSLLPDSANQISKVKP
jgi:ketosteroid isomerase-like protein